MTIRSAGAFLFSMAQLTQAQIINNAYYLVETDSTLWASGSDEYDTAKGFLNIGIGTWENYDNTRWQELFSTLTAAADGTKTLTAGDYDYACPTNMRFPASYVRTINGGVATYWMVIKKELLSGYAESQDHFCYFTGSVAAGFTLNFNSNLTLNTGDTIEYEYYKQATLSSATTDKPELADPYFLSYFIASHMSEGGIDGNLYNLAMEKLETMRVVNMASLAGQPNPMDFAFDDSGGFGY